MTQIAPSETGIPSASSARRERDLYDLIRRLKLESQSVRVREEPQWEQNYRRYLGDQFDKPAPEGLHQFVLNVTQNAIIANTAVQTEQRPQVKIVPRTANGDEEIYLTQPAGQMLDQLMQQQGMDGLPPDQAQGYEPLGDNANNALQQMGGVTGPDEGWVVNDALTADVIGTIADTLWARSGADFWLIANVLNNGIIGTQPMHIQWNETRQCYDLKNVHPMNMWIDPIATGVEDAEYIIWDDVISADKAKVMYPQFSPQIDAAKISGRIGSLISDSSGGMRLGAPYRDTTFYRDMVVVRTLWIRNQQIPLTPDEAVATGAVTIAGKPGNEGQPASDNGGLDSGLPPELQSPDGKIGATVSNRGNLTDPLHSTGIDPDNTMKVDGTPQGAPSGTFMLPSGALTAPDNDNWPCKLGILQVQALAETVILDARECPYRDIPVGWNKNIDVPFRPWGQGEPERLEDLQQCINRVASILHNHLGYYQSPDESMPQSMKNALKEDQRQTHAHPGRQRTVPDDMFQQFQGQVSSITQVPPLPNSYMEYFRDLLDTFKYLAGNVDVLAGDAKADWSGKLVQALQGAARGPIGFKSTNTERMIRYLTEIIIGCIIDFMPETEWAKIVPGVPIQVLRAVRERAKEFDYEIDVQIVSGKGVVKQVEQQKYIQLRQMLCVDLLTLLEKLDVPNAKQVVERLQAEQAAMMPQQKAPPGPPPQPGPNQ